MSEHQYYEFRAVDEPLDASTQHELRNISSRASITATSFTNTYSWGDLKGDPAEMLARWFDAFVYVADWGTRWLAFRFPKGVLPAADLAPYEVELLSPHEGERHICVHFHLDADAQDDWTDDSAWLGSLIPLRAALAAGDLRCLYLAWLADLQRGLVEDEDPEPPVPPGLGELDAAHDAFAEFMRIDHDLVAAASEASARLHAVPPSREATRRWLRSLDTDEKDRWLLRVLDGHEARLRWDMHARLRADLGSRTEEEGTARTAGALLRRAHALADARRRQREQERQEQRRREAERHAAARRQHLDRLEGSEPALWRTIDELIVTLKPKAYDEVVVLLGDLRELAERSGELKDWETRLLALRARHARKPSLLKRLNTLKLTDAT